MYSSCLPLKVLACSAALCAALFTLTAHAQQQPVNIDPAKAAPADQQAVLRARAAALSYDFGALAHYRDANAKLGPPAAGEPRVVFLGDSIFDFWHLDDYFPGKHYINRGISGQTTPQMLVRFRQDVIDLAPKVLVILAGTNDLAGNSGPETVEQIEDNYATFAELAKLHHITLVFASVMPVSDYIRGQGMLDQRPPAKILQLNTWLRDYCQQNGILYLDYFAAMVDPAGKLQKPLSDDGLHPNANGYKVIAPLTQQAITTALAAAASNRMRP